MGQHTGIEAGHRDAEGPAAGEPPGVDRGLGAGYGQKRRGGGDAGNDGSRRHAARGAERAVEAGGVWVWETSKGTTFCARKGDGGWV